MKMKMIFPLIPSFITSQIHINIVVPRAYFYPSTAMPKGRMMILTLCMYLCDY